MRVKVEVTAQDIRYGHRKSHISCPIARAIQRAIGGTPWVDPLVASVCWGKKRIQATLPKAAQHFLSLFDMIGRKAVAPLTFTANFRKEK